MHTLLELGERGFLLTDIGRLIQRAFEQKAAARGYSRAHWQILGMLNQVEGQVQSSLADQLEMEPITLSRHLDRMEGEGVVERRADPKDRRVKRVFLKSEGQKQMEVLMGIRDQIVEAIFTAVPPEQVASIGKVLGDVRRNLVDLQK